MPDGSAAIVSVTCPPELPRVKAGPLFCACETKVTPEGRAVRQAHVLRVVGAGVAQHDGVGDVTTRLSPWTGRSVRPPG